MVLYVDKALNTTIQKNLSKSKKYTRKLSMAELCYRQTIFVVVVVVVVLRFTVIIPVS